MTSLYVSLLQSTLDPLFFSSTHLLVLICFSIVSRAHSMKFTQLFCVFPLLTLPHLFCHFHCPHPSITSSPSLHILLFHAYLSPIQSKYPGTAGLVRLDSVLPNLFFLPLFNPSFPVCTETVFMVFRVLVCIFSYQVSCKPSSSLPLSLMGMSISLSCIHLLVEQ